ncbi:MAG: N-acyl homoserine lactone hydrolase [Alphaproteobacteria bacterium]|nr:N-acyl homoserine lactone hydrolase [Alphaproteobacteria bacterium]
MKSNSLFAAAAAVGMALGAGSAPAQPAKPGVERLYVLYCGEIALTDMGRFSPGSSGPGVLSDTCYLIKHAQGWLLWDTGLGDAVAGMPEGRKSNAGVWHNRKTLASQLAEIGVKPSDIRYLALSHSHDDHVGNVDLFPQSTLLVQKAEYDWPNPFGVPRFKPDMKVVKAEGDHDVFGDGSVMLISTPGHSPGHQCLLVKLPKTGALMFSGDAVHTKANWDLKRAPVQNSNHAQSLATLDRMAAVLREHNAQLWIAHEPTEVPQRNYAPAYYE